eukprot:13146973-Alexandrium_andersonii.AAC.1
MVQQRWCKARPSAALGCSKLPQAVLAVCWRNWVLVCASSRFSIGVGRFWASPEGAYNCLKGA